MSVKFSYDYVEKIINRDGYILLSTEYIGNNVPLKCKCKEGHIFNIAFSKWEYRDIKCPICNKLHRKKDIKNKRYDLLKKEFELENYTMLTARNEYVDQQTKLHFICPNGHKYYITEISWKRGCRCYHCVGNKPVGLDLVKREFEKEGYTLLSKKYINNKTKLKFICKNSHVGNITWNSWQRGSRCKKCGVNSRALKTIKNFEDIKNSFESEGYTLLSAPHEYKNAFSKLKYICSNGHENFMIWNSWQRGHRCPTCFSLSSSAELEIKAFLTEYFNDVMYRDRSIILPYELDIVIPDKKIAIEYCGLYWHSELAGKDRKYHLNKLELCEKAGYRLITIFEDEWIHKKDIVKSRLKHILGISDAKKIYARNCKINVVEHNLKSNFLKDNHLQGDDLSSICLGAFYSGDLVAVMTFRKCNIAKGFKESKNGNYELSRFCLNSKYNVVGIASKLFRFFINNNSFNIIYSYADKRWSNGNLYDKLGFCLDHSTKPNYWYIDKHALIRIHRFAYRKSVLHKKLIDYCEGKSEIENMRLNGHSRIWDCGNYRFSFKGN